MNRRGFLSALALAPVAAVVAPTVRPGFASGGYVRPQYGVIGHIGPEITNLPLPKAISIDVRGPVSAAQAARLRKLVERGVHEGIRGYASRIA